MNKHFRCAMLAAVASIFLLPAVSVAASSPAEQAAEMMARAQALDVKCNFLAAHERDKLSKFTARAELALATRESAADTKAAMQRGREAAQSVACSADEKATLAQILAAAMAAAGENKQAARIKTQPTTPVAEAKPATQAEAQPPMAPAKPEASKIEEKALTPVTPSKLASNEPPMAPPPDRKRQMQKPLMASAPAPTVAGLTTYENLTASYFRARRCGGNQSAAYQAVLAEHGRAMHGHSAAQVAAALRRGQARAEGNSCS